MPERQFLGKEHCAASGAWTLSRILQFFSSHRHRKPHHFQVQRVDAFPLPLTGPHSQCHGRSHACCERPAVEPSRSSQVDQCDQHSFAIAQVAKGVAWMWQFEPQKTWSRVYGESCLFVMLFCTWFGQDQALTFRELSMFPHIMLTLSYIYIL